MSKCITITKDSYSEIYDEYVITKNDFLNHIKKNIDSSELNKTMVIATMIVKFIKLINFYVKNKDNFHENTMKALEINFHDTEDGNVKSLLINNNSLDCRFGDKSTKNKAIEILKNSLRDYIGSFKTFHLEIHFITGTDAFKVEYQVREASVDEYRTIEQDTLVMTAVELKKFISNKFKKIKSISKI